MKYPQATLTALRIARGKARRERTCRDRLIIALADERGWVSASFLDQVAGFNFGRRLREARAEGIKWEWRYDPKAPTGKKCTEYRLVKE